MTETFCLIVFPGKAIPQGRVRFTRTGHTYTPPATAAFRAEIAAAAKRAMGIKLPSEKQLILHISVFFEIPKSYSQKKKKELLGKPHGKKPDVDNIAKSIMDALTGIVWVDDKQVYHLHISKRYGENNSLIIAVEEVAKDSGCQVD